MTPQDLSHVSTRTLRSELNWRETQLRHARLSLEAQQRLRNEIELREVELSRREEERNRED